MMPTPLIRSALPPGLELTVIKSAKYASQLARVKVAAFKLNPLNALMFPLASNVNGVTAWLEEREALDLANDYVTTIAVIDTKCDEILARAKWRIPTRVSRLPKDAFSTSGQVSRVSSAHELSDAPEREPVLPQFPEGFNLSLQNRFRTILQEQRDKYYNTETDYFIGALYTHPKHQGRGLATALLSWGIQQADADGANIYLESTPSAHDLYLKAGWEDIERSIIDLSKFGGSGFYDVCAMIRYPAQKGIHNS